MARRCARTAPAERKNASTGVEPIEANASIAGVEAGERSTDQRALRTLVFTAVRTRTIWFFEPGTPPSRKSRFFSASTLTTTAG